MPTMELSHPIHMDSEYAWNRFPRQRMLNCQKKEMTIGQAIGVYYNEQSSLSGLQGSSDGQRPPGPRAILGVNSPFCLWWKLLYYHL